MNYKKISFKTVWITFPEIEPICKSLAVPPTRQKQGGKPHYTVPFITITPSAGSSDPVLAISDSGKIAQYIDKMFPDPARSLFPEGTGVYHALFSQFIFEKLILPMNPLVVEEFMGLITTGEWYASTREDLYGVPLQAILPKDEAEVVAAREKLWLGFDALADALDAEGEGNCQIVKGQVTYSEMELVALLYYMKRVSPDRVWEHLKNRNGGRWEKLLDSYKEYLPAGPVQ